MPPTFRVVDRSSIDGRSESDPQKHSTNMPETGLLHVDGITKSFGGVKALDNVSARFYAGEVHALLGETAPADPPSSRSLPGCSSQTREPSGVNINLLAPGPMGAGLFERHLASADDPAAFLATPEARQPIGRIVGADEVANAAMFLLSAQASAVYGTTLVADGGLVGRV
jgi:hypothetical protein